MSARAKTREKLILAAEELVARVGPGGASAREIARNAGFKNNVCVQYHFNSIENLFDQVVHYRMKMLEDVRRATLEEIGIDAFESLSIAQLWEIVCFPQLVMKGSDGGYQYAVFLCNYLPVHRPEGLAWTMRTSSTDLPVLNQVLNRIRLMLTDIPLDIFDRRVTSANLLFLNTCRGLKTTDQENEVSLRQNPIVRDALRQSVAALSARWVN